MINLKHLKALFFTSLCFFACSNHLPFMSNFLMSPPLAKNSNHTPTVPSTSGGSSASPGMPGVSPSPSVSTNALIHNAVSTNYVQTGIVTGCGIASNLLDDPINFLALNRYYTPGSTDPYIGITSTDPQYAGIIGEYNNGKNCGRWIQVTLGQVCNGNNGGADGPDPKNPVFCQPQGTNPGTYHTDSFTGASLNMVVADFCDDQSTFCRDSKYHTDLNTLSLGNFQKNGTPMDMTEMQLANRLVSWQYIPAPNYTGDIKIYMLANAKSTWIATAFTHLENGISGVDVQVSGQWVSTIMGANISGQVFLLNYNQSNQWITPDLPYVVRIWDSLGNLVQNGRQYQFNFPSNCCTQAFTSVNYTIINN